MNRQSQESQSSASDNEQKSDESVNELNQALSQMALSENSASQDADSKNNQRKKEPPLAAQESRVAPGNELKESLTKLDTQKDRVDRGNELTYSPTKVKQLGRIPITQGDLEPRPYRSFSNNRERQLLRQVAVQLHFYLANSSKGNKNEKQKLVETQIMHLVFDGKHNLFIAVNPYKFSEKIKKLIENKKEFIEILCKQHLEKGDDEGNLRSKRYANKLFYRIKSEANRTRLPQSSETDDNNQANHVARLLKKATLSFPEIKENNNEALFENNNTICFISPNYKVKNDKRHAEEFLCDIAEEAKKLAKDVYASVAGKKRPCVGCSGRMKKLIDNYNPYPGKYWSHTIKYQDTKIAENTEKILLEKKSHASLDKSGNNTLEDFDSGSDSEDEETLLRPFIAEIPWCENWKEEVIEAIRATQVTVEELQDMSEIGDISLILNEGYSLSDVVTLYRENPIHITCLTYIANDQLEELILDLAPEVNPIAMSYVRELQDADDDNDILSWVRAQLGESDQMLWDANLDFYWNDSYEEDISKRLQEITLHDLEKDSINPMVTSTPDKSTNTIKREPSDSLQEESPPVPAGLTYKKVPGDGHCFYHAVALYLGSTQEELRRVTAEYIEGNRDDFEPYINDSFDNYIQGIRSESAWAGHIEINALMHHLNQPIVVIDPNNAVRNLRRENLTQENGSLVEDPIFVRYNNHNHYDSLILNNTVSVQTILEDLLNSSENPEQQSRSNVEERIKTNESEHTSISSSREVASPDVSHSESLALATPLLSCKAEAASEKGNRKEDSDDSDKEQTPNQRAVARTVASRTKTDQKRHQEPSEKTAAQPPQASDSAEGQTHEVASEKQQISAKTPIRKTLKELHEQEMDFYAVPFEACAPALAGLIERLHSIPGPELVTLLSRHDFMKRVVARGNDTDVQEIFTSLESSMARGELSSQALVLFLKDNVISHLEEREAALKTHFFVLLRKMLQSTETADALSSLLQEMLVQSPNLYRLGKAGAAELLDLLHEITCFSSHSYADIMPIIESTLYPLAATLRKNTQVSVNEASLMARRVLRLITDASTGQLRPKANPVLSRLLSHPSLSRKYKEALLAVLDPQTHRQYRAMLTRWDRIATAWDRLWKRKRYLASPESDDLSLLAVEKPQLLDLGHASLMQYSDDELDTIEHLLSDSFLSDIEQIEAGIEALEVTETLLEEFKVNNSFELTLYCQILSLTVLGKEQLIEDQLAQWQELHRVISHAPSTDWCETMDKRIQDKIESIEQYITHVIEEVTSEVRTQVENEFETSWNTRAQKVRDKVCAEYQFDLSIDNEDIEEMIPRKPDQKECFDFWSEIHPDLKSSIRESALDRINQSMNLSHSLSQKKNDFEVQEIIAEKTGFMGKNIRDRIAALAIDTVEDSEVIGGSTEKEREEYWSEAIKHRAKTALRHRWEAEENNYKEKIDKELEGKKLETWNRRDIGQVITRKQSVEEPAVMARPEWSESGAVADIERRLEGLRIFNNEVLERDLPDVPNHSLGFFNVQKKHSKPTKLSHAPTNG